MYTSSSDTQSRGILARVVVPIALVQAVYNTLVAAAIILLVPTACIMHLATPVSAGAVCCTGIVALTLCGESRIAPPWPTEIPAQSESVFRL